MIKLQIDVTKINKDKLFKGEKGTYLNCVLIETPNNQYGNSHMIVQDTSKEEREAGIKGAILGNAKELKFEDKATSAENTQDDNIPF